MKAHKGKKRGAAKAAGRAQGRVEREASSKRASGARKTRGDGRAVAAKAGTGRAPRSRPAEATAAAANQDVELEAAVLRRLLRHFDERKDVQNIELMILAGFCRNCLSKWFVEEAQERGRELDIERAREKIYGMPYSEWKERHQQTATEDQMRRFREAEQRKQSEKEPEGKVPVGKSLEARNPGAKGAGAKGPGATG